MKRRPRGNWTVDDLWVSWGPTEALPSANADFTVLARTGSSGWKEKKKPSERDYRAIINGLANLLAEAQGGKRRKGAK